MSNNERKRKAADTYSQEYDEWNGKTCKALRLTLKERGLATSGNKPTLINRLMGKDGHQPAPQLHLPIDKVAVEYGWEEIEKERLEKKKTRLLGKTNPELRAILRARGQSTGGNKADLVLRLLGLEPNKKLKSIEKSVIPKLLAADILQGRDLHDVSRLPLEAEAIWHSKGIYRKYDLGSFEKLLCKLRLKDAELRKLSKQDDEEVLQQLKYIGGMEETTFWGYKSWRNHPAKALLRRDMDEGKHQKMKPRDLRMTRPEYRTMDEHVFRRRIHQEIKARKQVNWNEHKRVKEESKMLVPSDEEWSEEDGNGQDEEE